MDAKNEQPDKSGSSQHQDDEQLQKHEDLKPQLTFAPTTSRPPATPQSKKSKSNGNGDVDAAAVYFEQWKKTPDKIKIAKRLHSSVWHLDIRVWVVLGRSIARSLAGSLARSLDCSLVRSLDRCLDLSLNRSITHSFARPLPQIRARDGATFFYGWFLVCLLCLVILGNVLWSTCVFELHFF